MLCSVSSEIYVSGTPERELARIQILNLTSIYIGQNNESDYPNITLITKMKSVIVLGKKSCHH